jgi:hypothetical protein
MIWPVPRLHGADLASWFSCGDGELSLPAGYATRWYAGGAEALADICAQLAVRRGRRIDVLLPGYFCGQSLRHLRRLDVNLIFYPLACGLQPDYDDIARRASADVLIHVHYFGHVAGQARSRACADALGAILIEDCAHVISPGVQADWVGDYLIFSPHKLFPLPTVGLAFARQPLGPPAAAAPFPYGWLARQAARRILSRAPATPWGVVWSDRSVPLDPRQPHAALRRAAARCLVRYADAAARRGNNARRLLVRLASISGWQPFSDTGQSTVPFLTSMLCDSEATARRRFEALNRRKRLVMQWPDLPVEIRSTPAVAQTCIAWTARSLHFFVHQQLDAGEWLGEIDAAVQGVGF